MRTAPVDIWNLIEMSDVTRRSLLLCSMSPHELLDVVKVESSKAGTCGSLDVRWNEAVDRPGYWRVEAVVPLSVDTFDLLFNGRMGYLASCRTPFRTPLH